MRSVDPGHVETEGPLVALPGASAIVTAEGLVGGGTRRIGAKQGEDVLVSLVGNSCSEGGVERGINLGGARIVFRQDAPDLLKAEASSNSCSYNPFFPGSCRAQMDGNQRKHEVIRYEELCWDLERHACDADSAYGRVQSALNPLGSVFEWSVSRKEEL